jgi:exonuclease III
VPGDLDRWTREWGGGLYINSGGSHSRGVAILLPKNMAYSIKKIEKDDDGRLLLIQGTFNSYDLTILNIYAPTADKQKEQMDLLRQINNYVNDYSNNLILAGDLNTYLTELDKHGKVEKLTEFSLSLNNTMQQSDMVDVWRLLNPEQRRYTWRKMCPNGIRQSRLDYIIMPNSFIYDVEYTNIGHSIYSDHSPVQLKLKESTTNKKGRGFWKFNTSLLKDPEYVTKINALIDQEIEENKGNNKGLIWDTIKMKIRGLTISFSSHKAKITRAFEKEITDRLTTIEDEITSKPTDDNKQELITLTKELELINNERTSGVQVRARAMHIELNEKNNKYFLNKEKTNYNLKNYTTFGRRDNNH